MDKRIAIIIGAGPAGLTAAYELLKKTDIKPIIYESSECVGGIARTVNYKGNRLDIGGHRFFSKSEKVLKWWLDIFPLQGTPARDDIKLGRSVLLSQDVNAPDPEHNDKVMLHRRRVSRIFFMRKFFTYPLHMHIKTFAQLGWMETLKMGFSYLKIRLSPKREEKNLEDFFINRFGKEIYRVFFKGYTQKVWGTSCRNISSEWGAQRIKGLSIAKALSNATKRIIFFADNSIMQKKTETSLIDQFLYPKYGPGQFWEEVAGIIQARGGEIHLNHEVVKIKNQDYKIVEVEVKNGASAKKTAVKGDYVFSTMPVKNLIQAFGKDIPQEVKQIAQGLLYRDFITVGLILKKLKIKNVSKIKTVNNIIPDNWIYIQERDVRLARIQIFNNWSPYMVKDENTILTGLEYFCNEGDKLWEKSNEDFIKFTINELIKIDFIEKDDVLDSVLIRMPKAYPAYCGAYYSFDVIRKFVDKFENLFLIGRNGMHRYNNTDHSMLTAMTAVENIINNVKSKDNIWNVDTK
jgi:protoporphyrinogen oxidase